VSDHHNVGTIAAAVGDFRRARFRAKVEQVLARLSGRSAELLEYEEVRRRLRVTSQVSRGLHNIPLDAIVGSVGRAADYTRSFLPRQDDDEGRWAKVKIAMTGLVGLPPIAVYRIDQAYFVLDGNHRVSVARQMGAKYIQAYVTEIQTAVPLDPDVQPDDLIVKAEYAAFLARTRELGASVTSIRPEADLSVSVPGQYQKLEEHIAVHQYFMGLDKQREVPYREAVAHWYDTVYMPLVAVIREQGMLRDLDRGSARPLTETDLYLWILDHRAELGRDLHWQISPEVAAQDLVQRFSSRPRRVAARVGEWVSRILVPKAIVAGPRAGEWRQSAERQDRLFSDVLVAVNGTEDGWRAVDIALQVAAREEGRLVGLHVIPSRGPGRRAWQHVFRRVNPRVRSLENEFVERCQAAHVPAHWTVEVGGVADSICQWGRWSSLAVVSLSHPPENQPLARLGSGFRALVQRCPLPVLAVPSRTQVVNIGASGQSVLLAYDGSPKADEALFVSTYLSAQWGVPLVVVSVDEPRRAASLALTRAWKYLVDHGVHATYVGKRGSVGDVVLDVSQEHESALIVMGGYGFSPMVQIVLGSAVDQVLRSSRRPVLICR
jgi:nucleotide-binding universal stress UspA family protein